MEQYNKCAFGFGIPFCNGLYNSADAKLMDLHSGLSTIYKVYKLSHRFWKDSFVFIVSIFMILLKDLLPFLIIKYKRLFKGLKILIKRMLFSQNLHLWRRYLFQDYLLQERMVNVSSRTKLLKEWAQKLLKPACPP